MSKQRWYQISLRAAIVIMLLSGILVGLVVASIKEEEEANKRYEQHLRAAKRRQEQLKVEAEKAELEKIIRNSLAAEADSGRQ